MKTAKFWTALATAVLVAISQLTLPANVQQWVAVALSVLGAIAVFAVPNAPAVTPPANGSVQR
jgi:hypothetical protein